MGAYQFLLDWYRDQYIAEGPEKWAKGREPRLYQTDADEWRLTTDERKTILLSHIYGVDIDPQAVEVTKLSLLLKVLEGESEQSLARQLAFAGFGERVLPDLDSNIKCGNSLIGPDFYHSQPTQMNMFDEDEMYRVNVFDWQAEFAEIMRDGGFDIVIGNPPYIRIQAIKEWTPIEVEFYKKEYVAASKGNYDIYVVFVEKGLDLLNERGGLGFILPHKFFNAKYGQSLRSILAQGKHLDKIVHFGDQQVFAGATTYTCLLFLNKQATDKFHFTRVDNLSSWRLGEPQLDGNIPANNITAGEWNFNVGSGASLFNRLNGFPTRLGHLAERIAQGIRTSANEVYVLELISNDGQMVQAKSKQLDRVVTLEREALSLFLKGREIKSYRILYSGSVVIIPYRTRNGRLELIPENELKDKYPYTYSYLQENKTYLENRERGRMRGKDWYGYVYPKNVEIMVTPKLLVPDIANRAAFAFDALGEYAFTSGYGVTLKSSTAEAVLYILGLLNSKVLDFYLKQVSTTLRGGFFRYFTQYIELLPIRTIDFTNSSDKTKHDKMIALVEQMLTLNDQLIKARIAPTKKVLTRQIEATDRQIDTLVYELYGLTDEEIKIVEG